MLITKEQQQALIDKLKYALILNLKPKNKDVNEPYLVYGGKLYTRLEVANEVENDTAFGVNLLNNSILLSIELLSDNKGETFTVNKLNEIENKMRKQGKHDSANQIMVARETIEDFYQNKER